MPFSRTNRRAASDYPHIVTRFSTAQTGPVDDLEERREAQTEIQELILAAAVAVEALPLDSREKSLALTDLQSALMWAGKHIFTVNTKPENPEPEIISDARDYPWANQEKE